MIMIESQLVIALLLGGATLLSAAVLACKFGSQLTDLWRMATTPGRSAFAFASLVAMLYAGTKIPTNGTDAASGPDGTNGLMGVQRPLLAAASPDAGEWLRIDVRTNANVSYAMPEGAAFATNWWRRGAYEDVTPIGGLWAYSWGKVRRALGDPSGEIVAVGAPMSAIPCRSRLWSVEATNGARLVTWENFARGRIPAGEPIDDGRLFSAQLELRENGDYVVRSNGVETTFHDTRFGPEQTLATNANASCYYTVRVRTDADASIMFEGDGPSDLDDPCFEMRGGRTYDVMLLIGKTYAVTCTEPVAVETSDPDVCVAEYGPQAFEVVWPVTIEEVPRLLAAPAPGHLGSQPSAGGFALVVVPSWLRGSFRWETNDCCNVVADEEEFGWWRFACEPLCACEGCPIVGYYGYEGYEIVVDSIRCGCRYYPDHDTFVGLLAPDVVFRGGALGALSVDFSHGDSTRPERGELTLTVNGNGKIRLWEDAEKTREASVFSWDVESFAGCTYYVEGVATSDSAGDIGFELVWTRPDGTCDGDEKAMTCVAVRETAVDSPTDGITDGSPNRQPFAANTNWTFDVTHSINPDKHYAVLFRDAVNDDFSVRDFSVRMTLVVEPADAPVGAASWFALDPTPASGAIVSTGARTGELQNPKVGGVYRIGSCFAGSTTNTCIIVLPLAGAEMDEVLRGDLVRADGFVERSKDNWPRRWFTRALFASHWFRYDKYGFYRGRPDNADSPTVRHYNQVRDRDGKGAIGTLLGVPIHIEKLSNLVAAYACERLGVPTEEQGLAERIGTANDEAAHLSWITGLRLAHNHNFEGEVGYLATNAYRWASDKSEKLWPNPASVDNHRDTFGHGDFDTEFSSPGFIYCEQ